MIELTKQIEEGLMVAADMQRSGDMDGARAKYRALLDDVATDDADAATVLHLLAVIVDDPQSKLELNIESLERAEKAAPNNFPAEMKSSIFANIGYSHRELGDLEEARAWYMRARATADALPDDDYGARLRENTQRELDALDARIAEIR
ncbi:MAG: hypothetical protein QOI61_1444 [Actinomycetota bacterium]